MGGYRGTIPQGLGIGAKVADFEYVYGKITEGSEDGLTFERVSAQLWFEVDEAGLNSDNWKTQVPLRQVKALYVL